MRLKKPVGIQRGKQTDSSHKRVGSFKTGVLIFIAVISLVTSSGIGLLFDSSPVGAVSIPTTKEACEAKGGTWVPPRRGTGGCSLELIDVMSPAQQAQSLIYQRALRNCVERGYWKNTVQVLLEFSRGLSMDATEANSFRWFYEQRPRGSDAEDTNRLDLSNRTRLGIYGDTSNQGWGNCNDGSWIRDAVSLWGYSTGGQFLCDIGFTRQVPVDNCADPGSYGPNNPNDFVAPSDVLARFDALMGRLLPGIVNDEDLPGAGRYRLILSAFTTYCAAPGGSVYTIYEFATGETSPKAVKYTYRDRDTNEDTTVYMYNRNPDTVGTTRTCANLYSLINSPTSDLVKFYREWALNPVNAGVPDHEGRECSDGSAPNAAGECPDGTSPSTCLVEGVGWIVCPIMNALGGLSDAMFGWISSVLTLNPLQQIDDKGDPTPQYETWQVVRNLANVLLVIAFLIIIFSQLTSAGISNYGVKKMLPRLIMVAIAINLSFVLMQVLIDLTNIVGVGIKTILDATAVLDITEDLSFDSVIQNLLTGAGVLVAGTTALVIAGNSSISLSTLALLALPFIVTAALSLFAAIVTLFLRNALVIVLAIISPLAFAAYLLPNTQELFNKWRKLFVSMLLLFPMAAILFGGANFAAYVVVSSNQPFSAVIALFLIAAPLGALPFLIRSSNSVLSGVGNKLQGYAKAAKNPLQRGLQSRVDNQRERYKSGERNWFGGARRNPDEPGRRRTLGQLGAARKENLETETSALKEAGSRRYKEMALDESRTDRTSTRARTNLDRLETEKKGNSSASEVFGARQQRRAATGVGADARYADRSFDASEANRVAGSQIEARSKARVENNARSAVSGAGLGDQSALARAATETAKATQGRIDNSELVTAPVAAAIQAQKENTFREKGINAEQQETFDQTVVNDADLSAVALETSRSELGSAVAQGELNLREQAAKSVGGSMLQEETRRQALAQAAAAKEERTKQFVAEASTDSKARYLNFAGTDTRQMLQNSDRELRVARSATAGAEDLGRQEHAAELQGDPALALRAAGVSPTGAPGVVAQATQVVDEARQKAISAETVLIRDQGIGIKTLLTNFQNGFGPDGVTPYTPEQGQAMVKMIVEGGGVDDAIQLYEHINGPNFNVAANQENPRIVRMLGQTLDATGKVKSLGKATTATLMTGQPVTNFANQIADRASKGKYTPEAIAAMDPYEITQMTNFFASGGGAPLSPDVMAAIKKAVADRQSDDNLRKSLNKETVDALTQLDAQL